MIRKEKFVPNEYYHLYSRTIFNIPEFKNNKNAKRLEQAFLISNSTKASVAYLFLKNNKGATTKDVLKILEKGEKLVDILCYAIMPDHYHLLVREKQENGTTKFIRSCNTSIAKYVNIKSDRKGSLFESRFKSKHVNSNEYLLHLSLYIHLNPLDFLVNKKWREHELLNWHESKDKLLNYQWSSLNHFLDDGYKNNIISGEEIIKNQFDNKKEYETFLHDWSEKTKDSIKELIID
jgi:putative transposase